MKKALIIILAVSLSIFTAFSVSAADFGEGNASVSFVFNNGGTVGFNTMGDFNDLTALASGDRVLLNEGNGITIGIRPSDGMVVSGFNITIEGVTEPLGSSDVVMTDDGMYIIDRGSNSGDVTLETVFSEIGTADAFVATGKIGGGENHYANNQFNVIADNGGVTGIFLNGEPVQLQSGQNVQFAAGDTMSLELTPSDGNGVAEIRLRSDAGETIVGAAELQRDGEKYVYTKTLDTSAGFMAEVRWSSFYPADGKIRFSFPPSASLSVTVNGGEPSAVENGNEASFAVGDTVKITVLPPTDSGFSEYRVYSAGEDDRFIGAEDTVVSQDGYSITLNPQSAGGIIVEAFCGQGSENNPFLLIPSVSNGTITYEVTFGEKLNETATENGTQVYVTGGADVNIIFTPDEGYELKTLTIGKEIIDLSSLSPVLTKENGTVKYVIQNVQQTQEISAGFGEKIIYGDIDNNGKVESADALMALQFSVKLSQPNEDELTVGDIDGDGRITSFDALSILRKSVGLV